MYILPSTELDNSIECLFNCFSFVLLVGICFRAVLGVVLVSGQTFLALISVEFDRCLATGDLELLPTDGLFLVPSLWAASKVLGRSRSTTAVLVGHWAPVESAALKTGSLF